MRYEGCASGTRCRAELSSGTTARRTRPTSRSTTLSCPPSRPLPLAAPCVVALPPSSPLPQLTTKIRSSPAHGKFHRRCVLALSRSVPCRSDHSPPAARVRSRPFISLPPSFPLPSPLQSSTMASSTPTAGGPTNNARPQSWPVRVVIPLSPPRASRRCARARALAGLGT